jgi:hypothetical protein
MDSTKNVIEGYERLLGELEEGGATERWQVKRRMVNGMLKISIAELDYHDARAKHGVESPLSEEDRADVTQAIELRRQIYRRRIEMIKRGL